MSPPGFHLPIDTGVSLVIHFPLMFFTSRDNSWPMSRLGHSRKSVSNRDGISLI